MPEVSVIPVVRALFVVNRRKGYVGVKKLKFELESNESYKNLRSNDEMC